MFKKILLLISLALSVATASSQPTINRAGPGNTVVDQNLFTQRGFRPPAYQDTTQANSLYSTLDSSGKIIYTFSDNAIWFRQSNPKKWVRLLNFGGGGSGTVTNVSLGNLNPLFTAGVTNPSSTPAFTFTQINVAENTYFGRLTGTGVPSFIATSSFPVPCSPTITKISDTQIKVCQCPSSSGVIKCDTLTVGGGIQSFYFINDSTVVVCHPPILVCDTLSGRSIPPLPGDSIICASVQICDTIPVGSVINSWIFQNGLTQVSPRVVEWYGKLRRDTYIDGLNQYGVTFDSTIFRVRGVTGKGQKLVNYNEAQMFFTPRRTAFRAGVDFRNSWKEDSLGVFSWAIGANVSAVGDYSATWGTANYNSSTLGTVFGNGNNAIGARSNILGGISNLIPVAAYTATTIGGIGLRAEAHFPTVTGAYNHGYVFAGTVIGAYNDTIYTKARKDAGFAGTRDFNGQVFAIGNGTNVGALRSNAMTVYNDRGKTVIGGSALDSAAQLRLIANNLAFKVNSGTTAQMSSIVSPYNGLLYWNDDSLALCEYTSGLWRKVDRSGGSSLNGTGYLKFAGTTASYLTPTQVTADLNIFTQTLKGLVPPPVAVVEGFLKYDGTWVEPADSSALQYISKLNDSTVLYHRLKGSPDTLVLNLSNTAGMTNPMTTLGDMIYGGAAGVATRLAGNITTTRKFPMSLGNGTISAAPIWDVLVAGDVPTLNQNTTGSAATLTTPRDLYGFSFNGSAGTVSGTNIIAPGYGGTNNAFTGFTGPATTIKTFTLPNASATILTTNALVTGAQGGTNNGFFDVTGPATTLKTFTFPNASSTVLTSNAAVTVAQGGTGLATTTAYGVITGGTTATGNFQNTGAGTTGQVLTSNGAAALPTWQAAAGGGTPAGNYGNIQLNRNGAFTTPATDSLDYESASGLTVKGNLNLSANMYAGTIGSTPTAKIHIAAGSTSVDSAPIKFISGSLNTTAVAGQYEYNGNHYITNNVVRIGVGGMIANFFADVSNTGTGSNETLYTYTVPANTLNTNGDAIEFEWALTLSDATATTTCLSTFAASTLISSTFATDAPLTTGGVMIKGTIIRDSGTTFKSITIITQTATGGVSTTKTFTNYQSFTPSATNAIDLKVNVAASGTGGAGDATARMGVIKFIPHASN